MPAKHARSGTRGLPPFGRGGGIGKKGSTRSQSASESSGAAIAVQVTAPKRINLTRRRPSTSEVLLRALNIAPGKNKVFALGPEVSLALARKGTLFGFVKANYQWETYARAGTQGAEFNILVTFLAKPLKLGKP